MSDTPPTVNCGDCGKELAEDPHAPVETRKPCADCGSTSRHFQKSLSVTGTARTKLSMKARHATGGRPFLEQTVGDELHRKSGKWMKLERLIDRARNWYREVVTDPETGQTMHECQEPLSEHRGHGAAKRHKGQPPES